MKSICAQLLELDAEIKQLHKSIETITMSRESKETLLDMIEDISEKINGI